MTPARAVKTLTDIEAGGRDGLLGVAVASVLKGKFGLMTQKGQGSDTAHRWLTAEHGFDPDHLYLDLMRLASRIADIELARLSQARILLPDAGAFRRIAETAQRLTYAEMVHAHNRFAPKEPTFMLFNQPQAIQESGGGSTEVSGMLWGVANNQHPILDQDSNTVRFAPAVPLSVYGHPRALPPAVRDQIGKRMPLTPLVTGSLNLIPPDSAAFAEAEKISRNQARQHSVTQHGNEWTDVRGTLIWRWIAAAWQLEAEHPDALAPVMKRMPGLPERKVVILKAPTAEPVKTSSPPSWTATAAGDELEEIVESLVAFYSDDSPRSMAKNHAREKLREMVRQLRAKAVDENKVHEVVLTSLGHDATVKWGSPKELADTFAAAEADRISEADQLTIGPLELEYLLQTAAKIDESQSVVLRIGELPAKQGFMYLPNELDLKISSQSHRKIRALRWEEAVMAEVDETGVSVRVPALRVTIYSETPASLGEEERIAFREEAIQNNTTPPLLHRGKCYFIPLNVDISDLVRATDRPQTATEAIGDTTIVDPGYTLPTRLLFATTKSLKDGALAAEPPVREHVTNPKRRRPGEHSRRRNIVYLPESKRNTPATPVAPVYGGDPRVFYTRAHYMARRDNPTKPWPREEFLSFAVPIADPAEREAVLEQLRKEYLDPETGRVSVERFFERNPGLVDRRVTKAELEPRPVRRAMTGRRRVRNTSSLNASASAPPTPETPAEPSTSPQHQTPKLEENKPGAVQRKLS